MSGRNIFLGVAILLLVGIAIYSGVIKFKSDFEANPVASPNPSDILFNQVMDPTPAPSPVTKQAKQYKDFPKLSAAELKNKKAIIETPKGKIEFQIYPEATMAAASFVFLANERFFDGLVFHRVEKGFVIQGGDPLGNGTGGPGYKFADEPFPGDYKKGIVAMANAGPNTNGSQFFICLNDLLTLPKNYTIFGMVTSGMDVVEKIAPGDIMQQVYVI